MDCDSKRHELREIMNILITGAWSDAKQHIDEIESLGHKVLFLQQEKDELPCPYEWVEGVICNGLFLHHQIENFSNLKYLQLTSAGFDRVDLDYVKEKGIIIKNARGVYSIPMAEFVLARVLERYKRLDDFNKQQENREWNKLRDLQELYGKRTLIVGCGSVGTECAKRFRAFGCKVIGVDLLSRNDENYDNMVDLEKLDEELSKADVVVLTLPLTEKTKGLIDEKHLNLLKEGCILVNIARGAVIDQQALEHWDGHAILDVFEEEPLRKDSRLWENETLHITPHNSFIGENNTIRLKQVIMNNIRCIQ